MRFKICSLCWPSRTATGRGRKGNRFVFRSKYKISLMFFSPSSSNSRSSPLLISPDTAKSLHFGESFMQSLTEKVMQVQSWMFFYLKCEQDKICSFSSALFLKEKAAHPNPVWDSAKERKGLSVTKDLDCLILIPNHGEAPPEAHSYGIPPSPPSLVPHQPRTGSRCPTVHSERPSGLETGQETSGVTPR